MRYKIPESTLVLVYTPALEVLLIERADHPEHWQSVTGSRDTVDEPLAETARRELMEETGIDADLYGGVVDWKMQNDFEIYRKWSGRYPPGTTHNTEHVFALMVPHRVPVTLAPREHLRAVWLPWREAAAKVFSWTNRAAIEALPEQVVTAPTLAAGTASLPPEGAQ